MKELILSFKCCVDVPQVKIITQKALFCEESAHTHKFWQGWAHRLM